MSEDQSNIPQNLENNNIDASTFVDDGNWVLEHRKVMEHKIWQCDALYKLWRYCVMSAKWADDIFSNGEAKICLKRGQFVGSLKHVSQDLNWPKSKTQFKLKTLRRLNAINTEVIRGITVITVLNYNKYQCINNEPKTHLKRILNASVSDLVPSKELKTKELKKKEKKEGSPEPSVGTPVWDAYASEFEKRFQRKPLRNAAVNSMCKKIAEMVGKEDAEKLVRFYVNHPKPFYSAKGYDLRFLVGDIQALHGEMKEGKPKVSTYEAVKRPIDIGPAYSYKERVVEDCPKCNNKGLLEKLDERGIQYRCSCYWFIKNGFKRTDYQADPEWLAGERL